MHPKQSDSPAVCAPAPADIAREAAKDATFWDVFEVRDPATGELAQPWVPCEAAAAKAQKFVLHKVRRAGRSDGKMFIMRFRCAALLPLVDSKPLCACTHLCRRIIHACSPDGAALRVLSARPVRKAEQAARHFGMPAWELQPQGRCSA